MFPSTMNVIAKLILCLFLFGIGVWLIDNDANGFLGAIGLIYKFGTLIPITLFGALLLWRALWAWIGFQITATRRAKAEGNSTKTNVMRRVLTSFAIWNSFLVMGFGFAVILLSFNLPYVELGPLLAFTDYSDSRQLIFSLRGTLRFTGRSVFWLGVALTLLFILRAIAKPGLWGGILRGVFTKTDNEFSDLK